MSDTPDASPIDKLKMHSPDLTAQNVDAITALFPGCVTEATGEDGTLRRAIDFDLLRQELSDSIVEGPQERYHLDWPGKRQALITANAPIAKTLRPVREESVNFGTTQNLFIEGDNLEALKLLQETYLGKVKMIYIDPPYNTGTDLIYDDDFSESTADFLEKSNQIDEVGNRLVANTESNGRFHSDWLSSLFPRLKICKNLIEEDGVVAISIDDNEVANLIALVDEVFGWENRKIICVKMSESSGLKMGSVKKFGTIPKLKEYIVLCSKSGINGFQFDGIKKKTWDTEYNIFLRGLSKAHRRDISEAINNSGSSADIEALDEIGAGIELVSVSDAFAETGLAVEKKSEWCFENSWRICQCATSASVLKLAKEKRKTNENKVFFVGTESGLIYPVRSEFSESSSKPRVQLIFADDNDSIHPGDMWTDIKTTGLDGEGGVSFKNGKKPLKLLKRLLKSKTKSGDTVMDFYAGSGSFGHAVMALGAEDGQNRRCILAQWPEELNVKDDDQAASYQFCIENGVDPNVAELSKERLRRSGAKILDGETHADWNKDVGFRVLKIDSSNMADIYYTPDATTQADLLARVDNIKPDRSPEDLLFQVLLDWGVDLTLPITRETLHGKTVFSVAGTALVACFDTGVDEALVKDLAARAPLRVVFRDTGFKDDATKINVRQIFKSLSPDTDVKAI